MPRQGRPVSLRAAAPASAGDADVDALARGVLVVRWPVVAWMLALAVFGIVDGQDPGVAIGVVTVVAAWVMWLTLRRPAWTRPVLAADLVIAAGVIAVGAWFPWLATVYPVTATLTWGAVGGVASGLVAGGVLGVVSVAAGAVTGTTAAMWSPDVLRDPVYLLLAGGGTGFVAALLGRSAAQLRAEQAARTEATERAARLTERETLARQIHDSVLQSLAMVHKHGRELAGHGSVDGAEVARLAELAGAQERTLRRLLLRPLDATDAQGTTSLRDRLEQAVAGLDGRLAPAVTTVGAIRLPARYVDEIGAAVDQALANVVRHARASRVWLYAECDSGEVTVTVRDDGVGFTYDEEALRGAVRYGLLGSIRGRVADLGGMLRVDTAPARGTELELRIPLPTGNEDEEVSAVG